MLSRVAKTGVLLLWATGALAADDAGYVLLEKMTTQFQQMGRQNEVSEGQLQLSLDDMMASAKKAKAEARIDQAFFDRYIRLVRILRVITLKDAEGILVPVFEKEVSSFVRSALGSEATGAARPSVAEIARAFARELDGLKRQLDQQK